MVIGVDVWNLTNPQAPNPRTLRYDLPPRLTDYSAVYWPELILGRYVRSLGVLRTYTHATARSLRQQALTSDQSSRGLTAAPSIGVFGERNPAMEESWTNGLWYQRPPSAARRSHGRSLSPATQNDLCHRGAAPEPRTARPLYRLLDSLCEDQAHVLLVRWPLVDEYFDDLEARYPQFAGAYDEAMADLRAYAATHPNVEVRDYGRASQWGLDYRAFYDYGHPSPLGRDFCTHELEEWAREHLDD